MKRITFISDTHNKHKQVLPEWLPGGDLLIHAGDFSSMGYEHEIQQFCKWFNAVPGYQHKVFIAGNHDRGFQDKAAKARGIVEDYGGIIYLEDSEYVLEDGIKIYGTPWQPEFYNWAFNLPRESEALKEKWNAIPTDANIVITHGPAHGILDRVLGQPQHLGCELLTQRLSEIEPAIHVCGHIHTGYGHSTVGNTHYFNAAFLNERYEPHHKPITIDWDPNTNEIEFVNMA